MNLYIIYMYLCAVMVHALLLTFCVESVMRSNVFQCNASKHATKRDNSNNSNNKPHIHNSLNERAHYLIYNIILYTTCASLHTRHALHASFLNNLVISSCSSYAPTSSSALLECYATSTTPDIRNCRHTYIHTHICIFVLPPHVF